MIWYDLRTAARVLREDQGIKLNAASKDIQVMEVVLGEPPSSTIHPDRIILRSLVDTMRQSTLLKPEEEKDIWLCDNLDIEAENTGVMALFDVRPLLPGARHVAFQDVALLPIFYLDYRLQLSRADMTKERKLIEILILKRIHGEDDVGVKWLDDEEEEDEY